MTELKHACHCVYAIGETFRFQIETELLSDGTACPAALLRLGVPAQRLTLPIILNLFTNTNCNGLHKTTKIYTIKKNKALRCN